MDDATARKFYGMYDKEEYIPETSYRPDIQVTPEIEQDKRQYSKSTTKKAAPNNAANNVPNNFPNINPTKISGRKLTIKELIKDLIYYNKDDPLDMGNYADVAAAGAFISEKYGEGLLEKLVIVTGVTVLGERAKNYLYENYVEK
jgi:hypothetical protein